VKIYPSATSPAGKLIPLPPGMVPLLAPAPGSPFQFSGAQPSRADARIIRMDRSERRACARTADSLTTNARAKGNVSGARAAWEDEHAREPGGSGHLDMALPVCRFESCSPESAISDYAGSNPAPSTPSLSIKPRSIGCACSKRDIGRGSACSRNVSRARGMTLSAVGNAQRTRLRPVRVANAQYVGADTQTGMGSEWLTSQHPWPIELHFVSFL